MTLKLTKAYLPFHVVLHARLLLLDRYFNVRVEIISKGACVDLLQMGNMKIWREKEFK